VDYKQQISETDKKNFSFLSFFDDKEVIICSYGILSQNTIIELIKNTSQFPFFQQAHISFKNTFRSIMIEMLQNVLKHGDENNKNLILLGIKNDTCFLYSANYINNDEAVKLNKNMAELDAMSTEVLDEKFKYGVTNNEIYGNGNAGLGLIEIIRKSLRPIQYKILKTSDSHGYFNFLIQMKIKFK
jgi:Family of unknown function (DUF6272)